MLMIIAILVAAIYFTLLSFNRLKKLAAWMKWLLFVILLIYLCDGIYVSVKHFNPDKLMESLISAFSMGLLAAGVHYLFKRRRAREKNWSLNDYPIEYRKLPLKRR
ncbi:hypothetical protein SAMN05216378_4086 [Paenibacillus catalpae]|uniref:Uncharacterized protein n=1 Tax=Paenibacillus catalpae TaxID=1045775 RepID=A0A1I2DFL9_9BACL|nr:hypothetical protein [Paenibacillus catalpae]SFE79151.1 hypothetical protein SAMN05216378_4086 [Paenibacillus catalpae]